MRTHSVSFFTLFILLTGSVIAQELPEHPRVHSEVTTMDSDRLMLKQSLTLDASVDEVWPYFTQTDLYTRWSAPLAEIDFKINGTIKANYTPGGTLGDANTITINILNYIPKKMITLQSVIPNTFPPFFKEIEKDLYNVIEFNSTEDGGTEIISYGIGYKDNDQFKQMIGFFAQGNLDYYQKLIDLVE